MDEYTKREFESYGYATDEYILRAEAINALIGWDPLPTELEIDQTLKSIPAANVVPVVHGRWEHLEAEWFDLWRCSACGDEWTFGYDPTDSETKVNYCPNCGAKMEADGND